MALADSAAEARRTGPDVEIAYVRRTVSGGGDIYATTVAARRTRRITRTSGREQNLAVSPDGTRIAFTMREPGRTGPFLNSAVWVVDASGGRPRRLTTGGSDHDPAWTEDGTRLLFSRVRVSRNTHDGPADEIDAITVVNGLIETLVPADFGDEDGTCEEDLTPWPGRDVTVYMHWDACLRNHSGPSAHALGRHGRTIDVFPWLDSFVWDPTISPDGRRIAYYAEFVDGREGGVFIAFVNGKRRRRLSATGAPSWSPDGRRLAVVRNGDIWVVGRDGSAERRLTGARSVEESPVWLPAGTS